MPTIEYIAQIRWQSERISALEAENAALKAERDEAKQSARRSAVEILAFMGALAGCQRDDEVPHETALRIADERNTAFTNLGEEISLRLELESDLDAARQSRARLVWLVRAKNGEFNHLMKLWGEARAWAAAWKRAAKLRRARVGYRQDVEWLCVDRRNRRARRAAEEMERR